MPTKTHQEKTFDVALPKWAKFKGYNRHGFEIIQADPDEFYPYFLKLFNVEQPDQYWLEVCYQCMKMDLQTAMGKFGFEIHCKGKEGHKDRWALKNHPRGKGPEFATQGREARQHYVRIRGRLPK